MTINYEFGERWEEVHVAPPLLTGAGSASDADIESTSGALLYQGITANELAYAVVQLPHGRRLGTPIVPHVHWSKTTTAAGGVTWQLSYRFARDGAVIGAYTDITVTNSTAATADVMAVDEFDPILFTAASGVEDTDVLLVRLTRLQGDAGDTYGADARLVSLDFRYVANDLGTEQAF